MDVTGRGIATDKRLPFEPLAPNGETIEAMKAARRGELATVGDVDGLMAGLNADDQADLGLQRSDAPRPKASGEATVDIGHATASQIRSKRSRFSPV